MNSAKNVIDMILFYFHIIVRYLFPFQWRTNWGWEKMRTIPRFSKLVSGKTKSTCCHTWHLTIHYVMSLTWFLYFNTGAPWHWMKEHWTEIPPTWNPKLNLKLVMDSWSNHSLLLALVTDLLRGIGTDALSDFSNSGTVPKIRK